jgi:hypothetical protein
MPVQVCLRGYGARIVALLIVVVALVSSTPELHATAGNSSIKIYEVAGAGALASASYRQDTIILFNPTQTTFTCTTCAIQTHSGTSTTSSWTVYKLPSLSIPAGGYYMISASSANLATYGTVAPIAYDYQLQTLEGKVTDTQNLLSSTTGTIALTSTQTALGTSATDHSCASGSQLLDLVGYGSSFATNAATSATPNSCYAGSGPAYYDGSTAYGRQMGALRKNKCIDTYDNSNDFVNTPLVYFNSQSTPSVCPTGKQLQAVLVATPTNPGVGETLKVTATVTGATIPSSSGMTAYLNFNTPYFSSTSVSMYDDGTNGDAVAGDNIYTLATILPVSTAPGYSYPTNVTINDAQGNSYTGSTLLTVPAGTITMSSSTTSGTISAGGVLTFPITITALHGYSGTLNITCTGSPNTNSLGVPTNTQCVSTPAEVTVSLDGTTTISVAIATGTTVSAGMAPTSWRWTIAVLICVGLATFGIWRRRRIWSAALLLALLALTMSTTACGTNAGMVNTSAAAGTYTYTVTATDANLSTVANSMTFTVVVK